MTAGSCGQMNFGFDFLRLFCSCWMAEKDFSKKHLEPDVKVLVVKSCFLQRLGDAY